MKHKSSLSAFVILLLCASAGAAEWFASPTGSDSAAGTETAPFRKIQHAVDAATAGDMIVLLPGDYGADQGTTNTTVSGNSSANRVVIDKPLTVIGRDGRDKTRIVGAWDTAEYADLPYGFGPDAVRCVWIASTGSGMRWAFPFQMPHCRELRGRFTMRSGFSREKITASRASRDRSS
jgi:hypothetical protein